MQQRHREPRGTVGSLHMSNNSAQDREAVLHRLNLFFNGVSPPYSRVGELAFGEEMQRLMNERHMSADALAEKACMSQREVVYMAAGLFRMEDADTVALERVAGALGASLVGMLRHALDAKSDAQERRPRNRYGGDIVSAELQIQIMNNPELHEGPINMGIGVRVQRGTIGMSRRALVERSGVCFPHIIYLEHLLLPEEILGPMKVEIADALGTKWKKLEEIGAETRRRIHMAGGVCHMDDLVNKVKRYMDIGRRRDPATSS